MTTDWRQMAQQRITEKQQTDAHTPQPETDVLDQSVAASDKQISGAFDWRKAAQEKISQKQIPSELAQAEESEPYREAEKDDSKIEQSILGSAVDMVTGGDRNPSDLPEFDMPFEPSFRQFKTAMGLLTTFDPKEQIKVFANNYPDLKFEEDENGDIIVDGSAYGAKKGMLNSPGISLRDLTQMGFQVAAFNPAAKAASVGATLAKRAATGAGLSALTQGAIDVTGQASGRTDDISLSNIKGDDALMAGIFGGGAEIATSVLGRMIPAMRKQFIETGEVTDEMRQAFLDTAKKNGIPADSITDDVIRDYMNMAKNGIPTKEMGDMHKTMVANKHTDEFGIPYTKGQITRDKNQLSTEDTFRHGGGGERAREIIGNFDKQQDVAIDQAKKGVQAGLSGKQTPQIDQYNDAGDLVAEAFRGKAQELDNAIGAAYDNVGDAYLSIDGLNGLLKHTKNSVRGIEFDPSLKGTASILSGIRSMEKLTKGMGDQIKPMHLKRVENMRRRFNNAIGAAENPSDKRQLMQMKSTFDRYLDDAVDNALFSGDEGALEALKEARSLRTQYAMKFQRRDSKTKSGHGIKDTAGDAIERIIEANPTSNEVLNYFFGASKLSRKGGAVLAAKTKKILGADSNEWNALREAAFIKLTATETGTKTVSPAKFATRLDDAIRGDGKELMKELFSERERLQFMRLSAAIKKADKTRENGSGTAYKVAQVIEQTVPKWMRSLSDKSASAAGMVGEPAMYVASKAAGAGAKAVVGRHGVKQAEEATRQRFLRPFNKVKGDGLGEGVAIGLTNYAQGQSGD